MNNICFNVQSPSISISNYQSNYHEQNTPSEKSQYYYQQHQQLNSGPHHHRFQTNINDYNSPILITNSAGRSCSNTNKRVHFESDINHLQSAQQSVPDDGSNEDHQFQGIQDDVNEFRSSHTETNSLSQSSHNSQTMNQYQHQNQIMITGLTKTKSYNNWKKENIVDSMMLKENSAVFNLVIGQKLPEEFAHCQSPSLEISPKNLYQQYYEIGNNQSSNGVFINQANISSIQKPPHPPGHQKKISTYIQEFDVNDHNQNLRKRKLSQFQNLSQISNMFPSPSNNNNNNKNSLISKDVNNENNILKQQVMILTSLIEKMSDNQNAKLMQMENNFKHMQDNLQDEIEKMRYKITKQSSVDGGIGTVTSSQSCIQCSRGSSQGKSPNNLMMTPHNQNLNSKSIPVSINKFQQMSANVNNTSNNQNGYTTQRTPNQSQQLFDLSLSQQSKQTPITQSKQGKQRKQTHLQDIREDQENSNPNIQVLQQPQSIHQDHIQIQILEEHEMKQYLQKGKKKKKKKGSRKSHGESLAHSNQIMLESKQNYYGLQTVDSIDNNLIGTEIEEQRIQFFTEEEVDDSKIDKIFQTEENQQKEETYEMKMQIKNKIKNDGLVEKLERNGQEHNKEKNSSCKCSIF
ncbi:UNKNOWN [Stylonychia lemnae]|uniref:Uncharacterized protein n=1 Tax=Stylonychia lemnae TaxID=5949 RepID=A0A078AS81_STYLE|nr:UNKNOWN [Stylonychia lemnae]|eukprot:CDW83753.1 UNKNOWN [Stylonychia lemnae]